MNQQRLKQLVKSDYSKLVPIILLALFIAFIPHLSYPYPLHVDEWEHLVRAKAVMQTGGISAIDPFTGETGTGVVTELEAGYHAFWGVFQAISGISWLDIYRYFPSVIFVFIVLAVYILARREGFGWEAAFFTCLIPTTVGILGPAFLVPVATGLFFAPLILFLAMNYRTVWLYLVIFLFFCFLLSMHAPSAMLSVIVVVPFLIFNLGRDFKHSLGISLALLLPFIITLPFTFDLILTSAKELLEPHYHQEFVKLPQIITVYGYIPVMMLLVGGVVLAKNYGPKSYALLSSLVLILLLQCIFNVFHYGIPLIYIRSLLYGMLLMSVVAGAGLMALQNIRLEVNILKRLEISWIGHNLGKFLGIVIILVILIIGIPERMNTNYYHIIDDTDYQAFVWIRDNLDEQYEKAVMDPWKGVAFAAITEKYVYSWISAYPTERDKRAYVFFENDCRDTAFLKENGISIVYTRWVCDNPDLVQVRENVYLLEPGEK